MTSPQPPSAHQLASLPHLDYEYSAGGTTAPENRSSVYGFVNLGADSTFLSVPHHSAFMPLQEDSMERPSKRRRVEPSLPPLSPSNPPAARSSGSSVPELIDMTKAEDLTGRRRMQEDLHRRHTQHTQTSKLVADQLQDQQERSNQPRISSLQCVVCMESMTNMTVTHCGHLFCHTCLMEALIAGENQDSEPGKGLSRCPICRKKVNRPKGGKDSGHVIPLELKIRKSVVAQGKEKI